jgi:hypothetical protein
MYKTVYTETEVEVDLRDFDTEELIAELQDRSDLPPELDSDVVDNANQQLELLGQIWHLRRLGKSYDHVMDQLIYQALGKIA